jgi:hypothetical protein
MNPARLFANGCLTLALCAGPSGAALCQPAGVPGFLDPQTGRFTVRPIIYGNTAVTSFTGTIKLVFAITIKSNIPTTDTIKCMASIAANDSTFSHNYIETALVTAARSGSTAACTISVPYQWELGTGASFNPGYVISAMAGNVAVRTSQYETTGGTTVGTDGSTTTVSYNVTL